MTEIAPGVFVHSGVVADWEPASAGDVANLSFIVGDRCVAVIDSGGTPGVGRRWQAALTAITPLPVCYVINTHAHPDHVLGNSAFKTTEQARPQFVAHARMPAALAARERYYLNALQRDFGVAMTHDDLVYPTLTITAGQTVEIDLGQRVIELTAWPTAHTDHDLTAFDRQSRTLFLGDLLFVTHLPVIDGSLRGWISVLDRLAQMPVALAVPGHGAVGRDWPTMLQPQRRYLDALLTETRAAIRAHTTMQQAVKTIGREATQGWALVDHFHERNVTTAFAELEWED
ncbi:MAG: quinoprotein relay system zinc metallohydrolase 2 [Burkholderiaceae bacterium]|nr:quinoprotein relay system zinc metallohydrolase 2 [Burkholderiaceae bacterium]